jgi:hypothetical protein
MPLPDGLIESVKNYLDITWVLDDAGDEKLSGIIARGMRYLNKTAGIELDYTTEDKPRELLLDYCRYVRSNALEEFQQNYLAELLSLQNEYEVKLWATLKSLIIGDVEFAFNALTLDYTVNTANDSDTVMVETMQQDATAGILLNGEEILNGGTAAWSDSENSLVIAVTMGSTEKTYTVTVSKAEVLPDG